MTARAKLAAVTVALTAALALPGPGLAQLRDAGTFGETCPAPPPPAAGSVGRLVLPRSLAAAPAPGPDTPGLPLASARSRRVFPRPGGWSPGTPRVLAVVGEDPGSETVVRGLPAGAAVLVLPPARAETVARLRAACPGCVVGPTGAEAARVLGVRAYPAVVRWTGTVMEIMEGTP